MFNLAFLDAITQTTSGIPLSRADLRMIHVAASQLCHERILGISPHNHETKYADK